MGYEMCLLEFCHLSRFGSRDLLLFIKCLDLAVAPVPRSCYTGVNNGGGLPRALPRPFCTFCLGQYVWKYSFEIRCKEQAACQSQVCRFWSVGFFVVIWFCFVLVGVLVVVVVVFCCCLPKGCSISGFCC